MRSTWLGRDRSTASDPGETCAGVYLQDNTQPSGDSGHSSHIPASHGQSGLEKSFSQGSCDIQGVRASRMLFHKSSASTGYIFLIRVPGEKKGFLSGINVWRFALWFQLNMFKCFAKEQRKRKSSANWSCILKASSFSRLKPSNNPLSSHLF